jgi:hypothetical protein
MKTFVGVFEEGLKAITRKCLYIRLPEIHSPYTAGFQARLKSSGNLRQPVIKSTSLHRPLKHAHCTTIKRRLLYIKETDSLTVISITLSSRLIFDCRLPTRANDTYTLLLPLICHTTDVDCHLVKQGTFTDKSDLSAQQTSARTDRSDLVPLPCAQTTK